MGSSFAGLLFFSVLLLSRPDHNQRKRRTLRREKRKKKKKKPRSSPCSCTPIKAGGTARRNRNVLGCVQHESHGGQKFTSFTQTKNGPPGFSPPRGRQNKNENSIIGRGGEGGGHERLTPRNSKDLAPFTQWDSFIHRNSHPSVSPPATASRTKALTLIY